MVDSDDEDAASHNNSSEEEEEEEVSRKKPKAAKPQKRPKAPEMSVVSSTKPLVATAGKETSFDMLLAKQKEQGGSQVSGRQDRPNGEMRATWKEDTKKAKGKANGQSERNDKSHGNKARRSASKNVFRRM